MARKSNKTKSGVDTKNEPEFQAPAETPIEKRVSKAEKVNDDDIIVPDTANVTYFTKLEKGEIINHDNAVKFMVENAKERLKKAKSEDEKTLIRAQRDIQISRVTPRPRKQVQQGA